MSDQNGSGAPAWPAEPSLWEVCRDQDKIAYSASYARLVGNVAYGVLLAQILYWFRPDKKGGNKLRIKRKGRFWLAKSREEWRRETGLTPKQLSGALKRLVSLGFIETERHKFAGLVTGHVWLNEMAVLSALKSHQCIMSKGPNPFGDHAQFH